MVLVIRHYIIGVCHEKNRTLTKYCKTFLLLKVFKIEDLWYSPYSVWAITKKFHLSAYNLTPLLSISMTMVLYHLDNNI